MGLVYKVYEEIPNKSGLDYTNITKARGLTCFRNSQQEDYNYIYFGPNYPLIHHYIKNNY